jgi:hypothetical protein
MKNRTFISDLREKLGSPSKETVEGLRLLRAFVKLSSRQRSEVIELVERFANDPEPVPDGVNGRVDPR